MGVVLELIEDRTENPPKNQRPGVTILLDDSEDGDPDAA